MRSVMLIDMDYFFAACEELRQPKLKGKPLVVFSGSDPDAPRAVVMTCNYEARKYKIKSGMSLPISRRLKPDAAFLPEDFAYYEQMSAKVMALLGNFAKKLEQVSIDEAFMDVTEFVQNNREAMEYAKRIKDQVKYALGLPCSVGIGPNKLIAKMACQAAKPDGIKLVKEEDAESFLAPMGVGDLYGVGRKTEEKLIAMGYKTIAQLAKANQMSLIQTFGVFGAELYLHAKGIDESEVRQVDEIKSIGREFTFQQDTKDPFEIRQAIERLSKDVYNEVSKKAFTFKTVTLKTRYGDFSEHLKSKSLRRYSDSYDDIWVNAVSLLDTRDEKKVRKIGVRVSSLGSGKGQAKLM